MSTSSPAFGTQSFNAPIQENQTYTLFVTRNRGWYGKIRTLHIYAKTPYGDFRLGNVKDGQTVRVDVPQTATHLYGKMDWGKSVPLDLTFYHGRETVYANLWFSLNPFSLLGITTIPCKIESRPR